MVAVCGSYVRCSVHVHVAVVGSLCLLLFAVNVVIVDGVVVVGVGDIVVFVVAVFCRNRC